MCIRDRNWFNGSCRPYNSTISYSDNTSYPAASPASYGPTTPLVKTYSNGTRKVTLRGTTSPGGLVITDGNDNQLGAYGYSPCPTPAPWSESVVGGCLIFAYPDDVAEPPPVNTVFAAVNYSGNSSATTQVAAPSISGFNSGGMFLSRWRSGTPGIFSSCIWDTMRGLTGRLFTERLSGADSSAITAFNTNGVSLPGNYQNTSGANYVGLFFKFAKAFFTGKIYNGTGADQILTHDLQTRPGMIWIKRYDNQAATDWVVWHKDATYTLELNNQLKMGLSDMVVDVTSTSFKVRPYGETNGDPGLQYVAYIWADDPRPNGIIRCSSFTTDNNGNAVVDVQWNIQHLLFKSRDTNDDWRFFDNVRGFSTAPEFNSERINYNDTSGAIQETNRTAKASNGFAVLGLSPNTTYLFMAVRE